MTVKELINKLHKFDPDLDIRYHDECRYVPIDSLHIIKEKDIYFRDIVFVGID